MRKLLVAMSLLFLPVPPALAQISFGYSGPGVSIGINIPVYPSLVPVPGYPVYYDPRGRSNYFFYDGLYWAFTDDNWYSSSWYNGPWYPVGPEYVPLYVLRVPVRYYHQPPSYFRGWRTDSPPRWGDHWGNQWQQQRSGWDHWDHHSTPGAAPLPVYQKQYSGTRYPHAVDQQSTIRTQNYRYQPREAVAQQQRSQPQQHEQQRGGEPSSEKERKD